MLMIAAVFGAMGAEPPAAEISNGQVRAKLYLPDAENGYYRATRFDWAGVVASLEAGGHSYFGKWFDRYDPKIHDAIMGPVEEFLTDGHALGYNEAKPGEVFVKIGVGAIRKPDEPRFRQFSTYEIANQGKWTVHQAADSVEFVQELDAGNGYAYRYHKTLRLTPGKAELVLEHRLENTGRKTIDTSVYEHNFFMLDGQPTGPDIRVENRRTGAAVRQRGDRPLSKLNFWSIRTTVCPEAYVDLHIEPGKEATWRIAYEFYTVPIL